MDDFKFVVKNLRVYDNEGEYTKVEFLKVFNTRYDAWKCYRDIRDDIPIKRPNNCYVEVMIERYLVINGLIIFISVDEYASNAHGEFTGVWE